MGTRKERTIEFGSKWGLANVQGWGAMVGSDLAPALWRALCRLEEMLREHRGAIAARGRRSHAELLGAE